MTKIAILGYGFMGKKHHGVINKIPNSKVTAIIDNNSTDNSDIEKFQCLDFFLENKPEVDLVIISTPNYDHFESAKKLLENGYNIFLEKPYCFSENEANILIETSLIHQKNIFFSNQNRFSPASKFLKKIIAENSLGAIYFIQTNLFWSRDERYYTPNSWKGKKSQDGGTLYTQFFHFVDLIFWLFGDFDIRNVTAKTLKHKNIIEIEDTGSVTFELKNQESLGVLNFSTAVYDKNFESSMTIIAENGTLKISGQYFDEIEYCNIKNKESDGLKLEKSDNFQNLYQNLCSAIDESKNFKPINETDFKVIQKIAEIYSRV